MKSCKICWAVSLALALSIVAMAYLFVLRGNVVESADGRTAIVLTGEERDMVLEEMRGFLESVQAITTGIAEENMVEIAENARRVGMVNAAAVPMTLMAKLPLEFKTLGMSTHQAFDELANEAQDMGNSKVVLTKLGDLMNNCTSCHATYRLAIERAPGN